MSLPQVWALSNAWYHNRLSPEYRGRTLAEVQDIFAQFELTSEFWQSDHPSDSPQK